ncbi:MAG: deoxyribose-phosphate aldolase [Clostridia bacterium]
MMDINRYLDHAILKPDMTQAEVRAAIQLGIDYKVRTVCVRPCDIEVAVDMCKGTQTDVSCVLDFPHGTASSAAKADAAKEYAAKGVLEIDMVMNFGLAKSGEWSRVQQDIEGVVRAAHAQDVGVKVIFETCYLTVDEIKKGTEVCIAAGADFVKTSTGFATGGATVEAVTAMLEAGRGCIKVKASGGIRDIDTARMYVEMGVDRLGNGFSSTPDICK